MIAEFFYMDTAIWVKAPYKVKFILALKGRIPKDYRYWDASEKVWVVNYSYEKELIALCSTYFSDIAYYGKKKYAKAIQSSPAYQTLHLLPSAPKEVIMAAYRALSKLYHPDVSKDINATEKMVKINIAFEEVMGRR